MGVELGQRLDLATIFWRGDVHLSGHLLLAFLVVRHELVQGRVEQADGHGEAVHGLEQAFEVSALDGQQLGQCHARPAVVRRRGSSDAKLDAVALEEHVLRAAEADALGAESECLCGILRRVGVGADFSTAYLPARSISWPKSPLRSAAIVATCPR